MDWSTVALLGLLVLLEGVRRVPAGAVVVRSTLGGPWEVVDERERGGWRIVSWWPPFTRHLMLAPGGGSVEPAEVVRRMGMPGRTHPVLTALGALVLLALVPGVPLAAARHGGWGLVGAALVAELAAVATAAVACVGLRRLGHPTRLALRRSAALLSPFAAPRASELLLAAALEGVAAPAALRGLLRPEAFAGWARPRAYDALSGRPDPALGSALGAEVLAELVEARPPGALGPYCPRCGRTYREGTVLCAGCDGVQLAHGSRA